MNIWRSSVLQNKVLNEIDIKVTDCKLTSSLLCKLSVFSLDLIKEEKHETFNENATINVLPQEINPFLLLLSMITNSLTGEEINCILVKRTSASYNIYDHYSPAASPFVDSSNRFNVKIRY